jgi:hypothetical protein
MIYDEGLEIFNFLPGDYAAPDVEIAHKEGKKLLQLENALTSERIEYKFVSGGPGGDRIKFKRISWPKLNYALYLAGLLTLDNGSQRKAFAPRRLAEKGDHIV